jgi:hypothetical protein
MPFEQIAHNKFTFYIYFRAVGQDSERGAEISFDFITEQTSISE